jgi:hypothetical protein
MLTLTRKLFVLFVLGIVLLSSVCITVPTASAAELNFEAKTVSILSDVGGLKTELYTESQSSTRDSQDRNQPQKVTDMQLASATGQS